MKATSALSGGSRTSTAATWSTTSSTPPPSIPAALFSLRSISVRSAARAVFTSGRRSSRHSCSWAIDGRRASTICKSGNSPLPLTSQIVCSSERASVPETREAVEAPRPAGAPARRATRTENERADRCCGVITIGIEEIKDSAATLASSSMDCWDFASFERAELLRSCPWCTGSCWAGVAVACAAAPGAR